MSSVECQLLLSGIQTSMPFSCFCCVSSTTRVQKSNNYKFSAVVNQLDSSAMAQTAVQVTKFNAANPIPNVRTTKIPKPVPGKAEVLVRITMRPCNPADIFSIQGVYPGFQPKALPAVPGLEGMGIVEAQGPGTIGKFSAGQRVTCSNWPCLPSLAAGGSGTYQQYMALPEDTLVAVPDDVSDEAAAMAIINPVTVLGLFKLAAVPQGDYLLITAAGSALSRMLIRYCKHKGVKTIGLVRRRAQVEEILQEGADAVVCTSDEDVVKRVKEITGGKGAAAAVDSIAGEMTLLLTQAVKPLVGKVIVYGAMSGLEVKASVVEVLFGGVTITGYWLKNELDALPQAERNKVLEEILSLYQQKVFTAFAEHYYDLEQAAEALAHSMKEARGGKVMIRG